MQRLLMGWNYAEKNASYAVMQKPLYVPHILVNVSFESELKVAMTTRSGSNLVTPPASVWLR